MTDLAAATRLLADSRFVQLTTFRRTGEPVPVPVWIAADDGWLLVTTPAGSGKVKRLRRDPRVTLMPCSRRGRTTPGAQPVSGTAEIVSDPAEVQRAGRVFLAKYRLEYRIFMLIERIVMRGNSSRVILRIRLTEQS